MLGYSKEKFECFITRTEEEIAYVDLADKDGEQSFMEIPFELLKGNKIECKAGILFSFVLKTFFGWEKLAFIPIKRRIWTKEEIEAKRKYYEEKYGDI